MAVQKFVGAEKRLGRRVEGRPGLPADLATEVTWGEVMMSSGRRPHDAKGMIEVAEG